MLEQTVAYTCAECGAEVLPDYVARHFNSAHDRLQFEHGYAIAISADGAD